MTGNLIGIFTIIVTILIAVIPLIWNKYVRRPELVIEIEKNKGITSTREYLFSVNNTLGPLTVKEHIGAYKLEWKFNLLVRNNSENNAYSIQMYQYKDQSFLKFSSVINPNKALLAHEEENFPFTFSKIERIKAPDLASSELSKPKEFKNLMLLLKYKNQHGKVFYTKYYFNTDKNVSDKVSKDEIKNWVLIGGSNK